MKIKFAILLALAALLASCGDKNAGQEADNQFQFESYTYDKIAQLNPDSLFQGAIPYASVSGHGLYPVKISNNDLSDLQNAIRGLGDLDSAFTSPKLPEVATGWTKEKKEEPVTLFTNDVDIVEANPYFIVWRGVSSSYYEGAAHGMYSTNYVNYYVAENKILTLWDVVNRQDEPQVLAMIKENLKDNSDIFSLDDVTNVPSTFKLGDGGLTVVYGLYEIAPYSAGEISVDLPIYQIQSSLTPLGKTLYNLTD